MFLAGPDLTCMNANNIKEITVYLFQVALFYEFPNAVSKYRVRCLCCLVSKNRTE